MVSALMLASTVNFGVVQVSAQAPGIIVVIGSDTTWTKADSPHALTGPLFVSEGATLTIEAGATVNLNGYDVLVNGTLRAIGSTTEKIYISNGVRIEFTQYSNGWNEQTGSGCIIENVVLDVSEISSSVSLKINHSSMQEISIECDSLVISNSNITGGLSVDGSAEILGNTIDGLSIVGGSPVVSNNVIEAISGSGDSPVISDNTIGTIGGYSSIDRKIRYFSPNSPIISNNIIERGIQFTGTSPVITKNMILGYIYGNDLTINDGYGPTDNIFAPLLEDNPIISFTGTGGSAVISNNTITGHTYNYTHQDFSLGLRGTVTHSVMTSGIIFHGSGSVSGNTISGCITGISGGAKIEGNLLIGNHKGIVITMNNAIIRNNHITNGTKGIDGHTSGTATIENNLISNHSSYGIDIELQVIIRNNTLTDNGYASIRLLNCPSATINYNNIEGYDKYSIELQETSNNIDATNNWWGTTDTQTINLTIRDFKYDFYLGKVNFVPFLTEPNPVIPEFQSWVFLSLLLTATLLVIICKRRYLKTANT